MAKMKKRILAYLDSIDRLLAAPPEDTDWQDEIDKHLIQIKFFMHERLVHELVMMLFAVLTFITILYAMTFPTIGMLLLIVSLMQEKGISALVSVNLTDPASKAILDEE